MFLKNEKGATLVEHAIALPIFLVFLLLTIELLRVSYTRLSLQYVSTEIMREAVVDPSITALDIQNSVVARFSGLGLSFDNTTDRITVVPRSQFPAGVGTIDTGAPKTKMIIQIERNISFFFLGAGDSFGDGLARNTITISGIALGTNEPA